MKSARSPGIAMSPMGMECDREMCRTRKSGSTRLTNGAREGIFRPARDCWGFALPDGAEQIQACSRMWPVIEGTSIRPEKVRSSRVDKGIEY